MDIGTKIQNELYYEGYIHLLHPHYFESFGLRYTSHLTFFDICSHFSMDLLGERADGRVIRMIYWRVQGFGSTTLCGLNIKHHSLEPWGCSAVGSMGVLPGFTNGAPN